MRTTLTISEKLWGQVRTRAKAEGVSASEYVRGAILMRMAWETPRRRR